MSKEPFELPPPPPAGGFDVRFASNVSLETIDGEHSQEFEIIIGSPELPLNISWEKKNQRHMAIFIDGKELAIERDGAIRIESAISRIILKIASGSEIPASYALAQNYPNPFNPGTHVTYELPVKSRVTLSVYDILGREIKTLVDDVQDAGRREIEWDSRNSSGSLVAGGVYFIRLDAEQLGEKGSRFVQVRKMLLIK
jgi:hypothetical protein